VSNEELAYIAGFLDGDGCVMAQLVRRKDYIYGYQIRTSVVFYQQARNQKILQWLKNRLKFGYIRYRNDGMVEYTIVGLKEVGSILGLLMPYLRLKRKLAEKVIRLIKAHPKKMTPHKLVCLSKIVDETAAFNYSKKRTNTSSAIRLFLENANLIPVETKG
jgi:intein-encoded DNA endonuclease-like protein